MAKGETILAVAQQSAPAAHPITIDSGVFVSVTMNLNALVAEWASRVQLTLYLDDGATQIDQLWVSALTAVESSSHESSEEGGRPIGAALELRVGLRAHPERMVHQLDELDEASVGTRSGTDEVAGIEAGPVLRVDFGPVPVPLGHDGTAIGVGDL